jgi:hypothetical protein
MTDLGIRELHAHLRDVVERFDLEQITATSVLRRTGAVQLTVSRSGRCTIDRGGISFAFDPDDDDEGDAAA